jgi:hypothetical protein
VELVAAVVSAAFFAFDMAKRQRGAACRNGRGQRPWRAAPWTAQIAFSGHQASPTRRRSARAGVRPPQTIRHVSSESGEIEEEQCLLSAGGGRAPPRSARDRLANGQRWTQSATRWLGSCKGRRSPDPDLGPPLGLLGLMAFDEHRTNDIDTRVRR